MYAPDDNFFRILRIILIVLSCISLVALLLTLAVYLILPDLRNLHGKIVVSNILSLAGFFVYMIAVYAAGVTVSNQICTVLGYIGYYTSLAMVFWMSTMCFDLCLAFTRPMEILDHGADNKKFVLYSLCSWGIPFLVCIGLGVGQLHLPESSPFNPRIGSDDCYISEVEPRRRYMLYVPILILMGINLTLFFVIILSIYISKAQTRRLRTGQHGHGQYKQIREQLKLYLKLLIVVGVLWVVESVHHFHHNQQVLEFEGVNGTNYTTLAICNFSDPMEIAYRVIDAFNVLRGVLLFVIFVCKKSIINKLRNKLLGRQSGHARRSRTTTTTVTSRVSTKTDDTSRVPQPRDNNVTKSETPLKSTENTCHDIKQQDPSSSLA